MKRLIALFILISTIWSCNSNTTSEDGKLTVVTTTGMIADIVKNVGKDSIAVSALMGPGVDPHLYKATQGDLGRLQRADIIFYNGLHLEGKMGEVFEKLERIKTVIPVARGIDSTSLLDDPIYQNAFDPHIWFDISLWASTIDEVTATLTKSDPVNAEFYKNNASAYTEELLTLHEWVKTEIETIPANKRIMITAHDAFNYFGRAYNIEVRGLQGISTLSEFGLKDRVDLVNFIVEKKIKAVFVETSVSEKNINAIVEGCRQKGHDIIIGGNLFSDAMSAEGTPEGNYIGMVKANVNTIVRALK
ncbi:metal ABC transporter solute-binding protein, Zn/Mn family [Roseivirga sp. E12]|uniref:metal ABC transporter solute-binding protein, Zn/Mn family n=1 Tax=Roseivirga sp. E12 TaxID=2819237 RepID=UPI001ABC603D|nr:zinc ABC transporter substrate-binding protein [Roseivirga sp. E12]MBO3697020.1 zinc ABC transporter substrate-binding protein [Roseivirga sp. E12]